MPPRKSKAGGFRNGSRSSRRAFPARSRRCRRASRSICRCRSSSLWSCIRSKKCSVPGPQPSDLRREAGDVFSRSVRLRSRLRASFGAMNERTFAMLWKGFQRPKRLEFERETLNERFGRFYAQPFERGFGTTVGNAMRRVLLSSIEGAAVTAVKIEGVLHEFSPIQGVVEDATDIILNLKQIPIKLHT